MCMKFRPCAAPLGNPPTERTHTLSGGRFRRPISPRVSFRNTFCVVGQRPRQVRVPRIEPQLGAASSGVIPRPRHVAVPSNSQRANGLHARLRRAAACRPRRRASPSNSAHRAVAMSCWNWHRCLRCACCAGAAAPHPVRRVHCVERLAGERQVAFPHVAGGVGVVVRVRATRGGLPLLVLRCLLLGTSLHQPLLLVEVREVLPVRAPLPWHGPGAVLSRVPHAR